MAQPLAIYASIPSTDPSGPEWLVTPPNIAPVTVANPFPTWPNLDWRVGNITPSSGFGEVPDYLWSVPVADVTDGNLKQFTRRLTAGALGSAFTATSIPTGVYRLDFAIAADDQYDITVLTGLPLLPIILSEQPNPVFNFAVPGSLPWRNVKYFSYGTLIGLTIALGNVIDIQVTARNVPQAAGTPPDLNPAMFTWVLQLNSIV